MGRCNNARTRAAAESLRNTPARARFSKPPSSSSSNTTSNRGGRGHDRGNSNNASTGTNAKQQQQASGNHNTSSGTDTSDGNIRRSKMIPSHLVVAAKQKLISKQDGPSNRSISISTGDISNTSTGTTLKVINTKTSHHGIKNIKELDEITLSDASIEMMFQLLRDLNVVVHPSLMMKDNNDDGDKRETDPQKNVEFNNREDDEDDANNSTNEWNHQNNPLEASISNDSRNHFSNGVNGTTTITNSSSRGRGYVEQDDDYDETFHGRWNPQSHATVAGDTEDEIPGDITNREEVLATNNDKEEGLYLLPVDMSDNPIYVHLTQHLSFPSSAAIRACTEAPISIQEWATITVPEQLSKVMDWLCLHLSETELEHGFRRQRTHDQSTTNVHTKSTLDTSRVIKYKATPHPSISIIAPRTAIAANKCDRDTSAWARQAALEDRAIQFLPFGFEHSEIVQALQQQSHLCVNNDRQVDGYPTKNSDPLDDTTILYMLLQSFEEKTLQVDGRTDMTMTSDVADMEEIEQECEVLLAIYEDQFTVESITPTTMVIKRCMISIGSNSDDQAIGELHVLLRPGYPTSCAPLFLLHNDHVPWPFLRRVNEEIIRRSAHEVGGPIIYEMVSQLLDFYPQLWHEYQTKQRTQKLEEQQQQLHDDMGHHDTINHGGCEEEEEEELRMEDLTPAEIKNLSRRQKAKLVQAQKSYDKTIKDAKLEEHRQMKQEQHQERIKYENQYLRQTMADRAILQRDEDQRNDGLKQMSRSAMSRALNDGKSIDDARIAAQLAEIQYRKEHGMDLSLDDTVATIEHKQSGNISVNQPSESIPILMPQATPTTRAFMDRLRQLYSDAAVHGKVSISGLMEPVAQQGLELRLPDAEEPKLPCPIAVSVGDVGTILQEDVLTLQKEQPWLVAEEARAPAASATISSGQNETLVGFAQNLSKRQKEVSDRLRSAHDKSQKYPSKTVQFIRQQTRALPAYQMQDEIVSTVRQNQVTLISASTGAGKTTVVPTLLLNDMIETGIGCYANIWVTQPRRISAIAVAERIASERGEKVGETCGYSIKLERKCSSRTRITLCTTGILLRRLQCDPDLANISHLIIDEVHERDMNSDFALIILKELLKRRKNLKLILMSATFEKSIFSSYFSGCAIVEIPGRAHPVREFRLEDVLQLTGYEVQEGSDYAWKERSNDTVQKWSKTALKKLYHPKYSNKTIHSLSIVDESKINYEIVASLVEHLTLNSEEGAILIFMPGMAEISNTIDELRKKELFQSDKVVIYPLHSSLASSDQSKVFIVPPIGIRKIVVATNIAETSITVSDIVYVVDSGRVKENRRDEIKEAPALVDCWVSKASAQQRRGRAGRVRPGVAYHLFSSHTHDNVLQSYQICEMSRVGIEDLVLQVLILDLGDPCSVLARAITPPSAVAMKNSLKLLEELGAIECQWQSHFDESSTCANLIDTKTELTPLGFHLATLPVDPRIGKVIIYGALFSCIEPALTIAAAMSSKSPFISSFENREAADRARATLSVDGSDHLTILNAFDQWKTMRISKGERAARNFVRDYYLSWHTLVQLEEIRNQLFALLCDIGFLPPMRRSTGDKLLRNPTDDAANVNANNIDLLKGVLCTGMYPNIIVAPRTMVNGRGSINKQAAGEIAFQSRTKGEVYLHPSVLSFSSKTLPSRYCCYHEIVQTRKLYARDITVVSPFALLLFGGALQVYHTDGIMTVDQWLQFRISRVTATLIKYLRSEMETMLLQTIVTPGQNLAATPHSKAITDAICALFLEKHPNR